MPVSNPIHSLIASGTKVGFASSPLAGGGTFLEFFAEVSDGPVLGVEDRRRAVILTGAVARDPERGYGGVDRWEVPPALRGDPEDFRCEDCGAVGCPGDCRYGDCDDFDPD